MEDRRIAQVTVLSGIVWITGTPSSGDTLLRCGECHGFGSEYPHVIEAIVEATVSLNIADDLQSP